LDDRFGLIVHDHDHWCQPVNKSSDRLGRQPVVQRHEGLSHPRRAEQRYGQGDTGIIDENYPLLTRCGEDSGRRAGTLRH
jgi:hypothetical protein